jgi:carboxypeptidase PM20D1
MMRKAMTLVVAATLATVLAASAPAAPPAGHPQAEAQALDLAMRAIALRSVRGPGNQTPQVAALYKAALVAGGFADGDVTITPVEDTAFLIARWHGSNARATSRAATSSSNSRATRKRR